MTATTRRTTPRTRRAASAALAAALTLGALSPALAATEGERHFEPHGTPVSGADRATSGEAPTLTPGTWTDTMTVGDGGIRYYSVERTIPGSRLRVAASADPRTADGGSVETLRANLLSPTDASSCSGSRDTQRWDRHTAHLVTATTLSSVANYDVEKCVQADRLVLQLARPNGSQVPADVEINVVEEPPLASASNLPSGLTTDPPDPQPLELASDEQVRGGTGFDDAPLLTSGTYVDELIPGEVAYYRTSVDWGQSATFALDGPVDDAFVGGSGSERLDIIPRLYAPDRRHLTEAPAAGSGDTQQYSLDALPVQHLMAVKELRYNNRAEGSSIVQFSLAGDHYYALSIPTDRQGTASGQPVPVRFAVEVSGEAGAAPDYTEPFSLIDAPPHPGGGEDAGGDEDGSAATGQADDATTDGAQATSTTEETSDPPYLLIALGALAVLLGAGTGLLLTGRRRTV